MQYNIHFYVINHTNLDSIDLSQFDAVYSPSVPINVSKYPNSKFLFGPHFSVFPETNQMDIIRVKNVIYTQPSDWARDVWRNNSLCNGIRIESLPFGVDTERFKDVKPIIERDKVMIYFKHRNPNELKIIENYMKSKYINYTVFSYDKRYNENDYISYLQNTKYCIWVDAHESQGFALEEALSMNVPLLVWNITSMNQEYGSKYNDIPATTIPYWDKSCGEYFYNINEFENIFNLFITNLETYTPREYIVENLSIKKCEEKFINLINSF
jgi:hypothetical protein